MKAPKVQNISTKDDVVVSEVPLACANEAAAVAFMERQRWGDRPFCPRCGDESVYQMMDSKTGERQADYRWRCRGCKDQFTVRIGTVLEDSRIPLRHWNYAFWRASTSKKGVSALEIKRQTGLSYKSALFLMARIRFAMAEEPTELLKGDVQVDEVYLGGRPRYPNVAKRGTSEKTPVIAMVESGGRVKAKPVANVTGATVKAVILAHVDRSARIITDEAYAYRGVGRHFTGGHKRVNHSKREYSLGGGVTTNSVEGFFSLLRRSIHGIYHAVSIEHLPKYLAEAEFRYNHRHLTDGQRTRQAIRSARGKRLTYEQSKA